MTQYILIHGLGQPPSSWDRTLSRLDVRDRAACPDLFALAQGRACTYQAIYQGFSALCAGAGGPVHLCGLSLGAILAIQYAEEHPEGVASLALIGAQYRMPRALLQVQNAAFRLMPARAFAQMGPGKREIMELTRSMGDLDLSQGLSQISCPTLVLCGERDRANQKAAQELAERIPGAELGWIAGAGHQVNTEAPELLADALNRFYGQGPRA